MTPWIQVYSNILTHDKTYALAEALKVPNYAAVGLMVSLWSWAAVNAVDGDITAFPKRAISDATGWEASTTAGRKNSPDIYQSLIDVRLIETVGDRVRIRNWDYYASLLIDSIDWQKEKTKQRVKKHRQRRQTVISPDESGECNVTVTLHDTDCNVTDCVTCNGYSNADVTQCNGATVPNHTVKEKYIKENDGHDDNLSITGLFEQTYAEYPHKEGKAKALLAYRLYLTGGKEIARVRYRFNHQQIHLAVCRYADECEGKESRYIKYFDTFMNGAVVDYVEKTREEYEAAMLAEYGENWRDIKYAYV